MHCAREIIQYIHVSHMNSLLAPRFVYICCIVVTNSLYYYYVLGYKCAHEAQRFIIHCTYISNMCVIWHTDIKNETRFYSPKTEYTKYSFIFLCFCIIHAITMSNSIWKPRFWDPYRPLSTLWLMWEQQSLPNDDLTLLSKKGAFLFYLYCTFMVNVNMQLQHHTIQICEPCVTMNSWLAE